VYFLVEVNAASQLKFQAQRTAFDIQGPVALLYHITVVCLQLRHLTQGQLKHREQSLGCGRSGYWVALTWRAAASGSDTARFDAHRQGSSNSGLQDLGAVVELAQQHRLRAHKPTVEAAETVLKCITGSRGASRESCPAVLDFEKLNAMNADVTFGLPISAMLESTTRTGSIHSS
jgi:hypothetical protein